MVQKRDEELLRIGFHPLKTNHFLYSSKREGHSAIIDVYVNDIIIMTNSMHDMTRVKKTLMVLFKMKVLGPIQSCFGIKFRQVADGTIKMSRIKYAEDKSSSTRFGIKDCKPVNHSPDLNVKLKSQQVHKISEKYPFHNIFGFSTFFAVSTRQDIAYAVSARSTGWSIDVRQSESYDT